MSLTIFRPNYAANTAANAVEHLFDSFWNGAWSPSATRELSPRVDAFDEGNALVVEVELPGVKKTDVSVSLERGVLTIKADKKSVREKANKESYIAERNYGTYERSFRLSDDVDPESVKAGFEDGVLRIEMNRRPESAGRKIEIR